MDINHLTSSKEDFIPSIIEWGRLDAKTNKKRHGGELIHQYEMTSAGGDCFALPIKNFKSHTHPEGAEGEYNDFILLDSGRPGAFVHILHFLNIETPLTSRICGNHKLSTIYRHSSTSTLPPRMVGVVCTHQDQDHIGGIATLLALSENSGTESGVIDQAEIELRMHIKEEEESYELVKSEWSDICKRATKDIQFIICPEKAKSKFNLFSFGNENGTWEEVGSSGVNTILKQIFEQTCGQVLVKCPGGVSIRRWSRTSTVENKSTDKNTADLDDPEDVLSSSSRDDDDDDDDDSNASSSSEDDTPPTTPKKKKNPETSFMSPSVAMRRAIPTTGSPAIGNATWHCGDASPDNLRSLITCYIGSYDGKQVHYVFGGDSCERIAEEVRARLPPNRYCFDELLRKTKNAGVDIFKPEETNARKRIGKLIYGTGRCKYTSAEKRWDMFQLNHHGSIKNVLYYDEKCVYQCPEKRSYSSTEIATQLCSKARGFFATSPGTRCHADPLVLEALCEREETQPSVRVVHMAYPTICASGHEHPDYTALKETGFLETNFTYEDDSYLFAAPLIPFLTDPKRVRKRICKILRLLTGTDTFKSSDDMMQHFVLHPPDSSFQGLAAVSYHMLQAHRFLKLMDPIVLCLQSAEYIVDDFPKTTRRLLRVTTAILRAFDEQLETWDIDKLLSFEPNAAPKVDANNPEGNTKLSLSFIHLLIFQCCAQWMLLQTNEYCKTKSVIHLNTALKLLLLTVTEKCVQVLSPPNPIKSVPVPEEGSDEDEESYNNKKTTNITQNSTNVSIGTSNWTSFVSSAFARCSETDAADFKALLLSIEELWDIVVDRCEEDEEEISDLRKTNSPVLSFFKRIKKFASLIQPLRDEIAKVLKFVDESEDKGLDRPGILRRKLLNCVQSMATILSEAPALSLKPLTKGISMDEQAKQYVQSIFLNKSARTHSEAVVKAMTAAKVNSRIQDCFTQIHATVDTEFDRLVDVMNNQWEIVDEEDVEEKAE